MVGIITNQTNASAAYTGDSNKNSRIDLSFSRKECFESNWRNLYQLF